MISCKLEQIGDRVALVLEPDDLDALNIRLGETVRLEPDAGGVVRLTALETGAEDVHARGRAFLKRYRRTFEQLA